MTHKEISVESVSDHVRLEAERRVWIAGRGTVFVVNNPKVPEIAKPGTVVEIEDEFWVVRSLESMGGRPPFGVVVKPYQGEDKKS